MFDLTVIILTKFLHMGNFSLLSFTFTLMPQLYNKIGFLSNGCKKRYVFVILLLYSVTILNYILKLYIVQNTCFLVILKKCT